LISSREGVVGAWKQVDSPPPNYATDSSALDLWSAPVRLKTLQAEMLAGIYYDDSGKESVAVEYRSRHDASSKSLIHLLRPRENDFAAQLDYVNNYAALRYERSGEIVSEQTKILAFLGSVGFLHPDRMRRTTEVLKLVLGVTGVIEMRIKHALACRRPVEYSPQIQPMISTPGHGSLPSGHSSESFAAAFVFYDLITQAGATEPSQTDPVFVQLMRIAERIAINRTVAGVHFPVDSVAGMVLGQTLAEFFIARFRTANVRPRTFDGRGFEGDFSYERVLKMDYFKSKELAKRPEPIIKEGTAVSMEESSLLRRLWDEAIAECTLMINPRPKAAR